MFKKVSMLFAAMLVFGFSTVATQAAVNEPPDDTPVVVIEDNTVPADCKSWEDSPANEKPCDPGSIIIARDTTYKEVKAKKID